MNEVWVSAHTEGKFHHPSASATEDAVPEEFALCFGTNRYPSGTGPSNISLT